MKSVHGRMYILRDYHCHKKVSNITNPTTMASILHIMKFGWFAIFFLDIINERIQVELNETKQS